MTTKKKLIGLTELMWQNGIDIEFYYFIDGNTTYFLPEYGIGYPEEN